MSHLTLEYPFQSQPFTVVCSVTWPLNGSDRCSGKLRCFLCPTLVSCWSIHLSHFIIVLKSSLSLFTYLIGIDSISVGDSLSCWSVYFLHFIAKLQIMMIFLLSYFFDLSNYDNLSSLIKLTQKLFTNCGEQGWCSGESARLPPMCPGFDSRTRRHMWAEFVGSLLYSERFFSGNSGFPLSSKTNIWFDLIYLIYSLPN